MVVAFVDDALTFGDKQWGSRKGRAGPSFRCGVAQYSTEVGILFIARQQDRRAEGPD